MALHHTQRLEWQEPAPEDAEKLQAILRSYEDRDEGVMLGWARREPRLFRMLLGPEFGPHVTERGTERDESLDHLTAGTFAMFAADRGYYSVIEALLESGLHPEDRDVFIAQPLLHHPKWRLHPEALATALSYGADAAALLVKMAGRREWSTARRLCDLLLLEFGAMSLPTRMAEDFRKGLESPPSAREQAWVTEVSMRAKLKQQFTQGPTEPPADPVPVRRRKCV